VWIDDQKEDMFAKKLGITQVGYPNVAVYDAGSEFLGRIIGFPGKDPWFEEVKNTWGVGEKLAAAKAKAEKDPAAWAEVATILSEIDDRLGDALAALEKVPEAKRAKDYKATKALLLAKETWSKVDPLINEMFQAAMKDVGNDPAKRSEVMKTVAPKGLEVVESFLKSHQGADPKLDAAAWAKKGFFLVLLEKKAEAAEIVRKILKEWPDSDQARAILGAMR
jgi:hypothetical protein